MLFASPLQPIFSKFAPVRRRTPLRPGPVQARYRWLSSVGHTQDLPGSWRIHPVPLPRSRIPASSSALTFSARRCSPHFADGEDTSTTEFSRLNHAASVPAAYASSDALPHPHARLASGRWLTLAGWELNPLDSIEKFLSSTSDFLLSQIYPGATTKLPQSPGALFVIYLLVNTHEVGTRLARSARALASFASYADPLLSHTEIVSSGPERHSHLGKAETS